MKVAMASNAKKFETREFLIEQAKQKWIALFGLERVIDDSSKLSEAESATFPTTARIFCILKLKSTKEVSEALKIANDFDLSVYPISRGKNWGYGSRAPTSDGVVLFDLSEMRQILSMDESFGFVRVQPGVSIRQVWEYLAEKKSEWMLPPGGMVAEASLLGNVMERGFAQGRTGERVEQACNFEVVLADGRVLSTGLSRFPNALAKDLYRWGLGPSLDGLFTQSNLGIVTAVTVWLTPRPSKHFQAALVAIESDEQLTKAIGTLRKLVRDGLIGTPFAAWNSLKIAAIHSQYPWEEMKGHAPLSKEVEISLLKKSLSLPVSEWNVQLGIYANSFLEGFAKRRNLVSRLKQTVHRLVVIGRFEAFMAKIVRIPFLFLTGIDPDKAAEVAYRASAYRGYLGAKGVKPVYWRKKRPMSDSPDPDRDQCGLIWVTSVIPFEGPHVAKALGLIRETCHEFQFETMITLIFLNDRYLCSLAAIKYDRESLGEDQKAMKCFERLQSLLVKEGFPPYRLGLQMPFMSESDPVYEEVIAALKKSLDPKETIAPNRYFRSQKKS